MALPSVVIQYQRWIFHLAGDAPTARHCITAIRPNIAIMCAHSCKVQEREELEIVPYCPHPLHPRPYRVRVLKIITEADLAILQCNEQLCEVGVGILRPHSGMLYNMLGFPESSRNSQRVLLSSTLGSICVDDFDKHGFLTGDSGFSLKGDSGGPCFMAGSERTYLGMNVGNIQRDINRNVIDQWADLVAGRNKILSSIIINIEIEKAMHEYEEQQRQREQQGQSSSGSQ